MQRATNRVTSRASLLRRCSVLFLGTHVLHTRQLSQVATLSDVDLFCSPIFRRTSRRESVCLLRALRAQDVLREAQMAKEKGVPYSIVFVGVNGVGKSTNLAKVAYWLLQHDMTVMIAACDTFRAGASSRT